MSDWLVSLRRHGPVVGHCFRRDSTEVWKVEKEMASLIEDEVEVSVESLQGAADTVGSV